MCSNSPRFQKIRAGQLKQRHSNLSAPAMGASESAQRPIGRRDQSTTKNGPRERQTHEECPTGQNVRAAYCNARRSRADESSNSKYKTAAGDGRNNRDFSKAAPTRHKLTERAPASNRQPDPTGALQCWVTPWAARSSKSARASRDYFFLCRAPSQSTSICNIEMRMKCRRG